MNKRQKNYTDVEYRRETKKDLLILLKRTKSRLNFVSKKIKGTVGIDEFNKLTDKETKLTARYLTLLRHLNLDDTKVDEEDDNSFS